MAYITAMPNSNPNPRRREHYYDYVKAAYQRTKNLLNRGWNAVVNACCFLWSKLTHDNISAAGVVVTAVATLMMAVATVAIYRAALLQYRTFEGQRHLMQGQLDEMEAEQRPWVRPRLTGLGDITITDKKFDFSIKLQWVNTGRSPAFAVKGYPWLRKGYRSLFEEHNNLCRTWETMPTAADKNPQVIFPNEANEPAFQGVSYGLQDDVANLQVDAASASESFLAPEILWMHSLQKRTRPPMASHMV